MVFFFVYSAIAPALLTTYIRVGVRALRGERTVAKRKRDRILKENLNIDTCG